MPKAPPLIVFVGSSGSGKTTLCDALAAKPGYRKVKSTTSRPARDDRDALDYHRDTPETIMNSASYVMAVEFAGNCYAVQRSEFEDDSVVLVMTGQPAILERIQHLCNELGRQLVVVHLKKSAEVRKAAMAARGDSESDIAKRLAKDNLDSDMEKQQVKASLVVEDFVEIDSVLAMLTKCGFKLPGC